MSDIIITEENDGELCDEFLTETELDALELLISAIRDKLLQVKNGSENCNLDEFKGD